MLPPPLKTLIWIGLALALLAYSLRAGVHATSHNYNISVEANSLFGALNFSQYKKVYSPREERPYSMYVYTPLHAYVTGGLLRLFSVEKLHYKVLFIRILSLISFFMILWILYRYLLFRSVSVLSFFCTVALGYSKWIDYITSARNDLLSLLLEGIAFALFLSWIKKEEKSTLVLFTFVTVLSVYTRQTGLVALGAGVIWLFFTQRWKPFFTVSLLFTLLFGITFYGLHTEYGPAFFEQAVLSNLRKGIRPMDILLKSSAFQSFLIGHALFVFLTLRNQFRPFTAEEQFLRLALILSFVEGAMVFLRPAGDVNYFFETIFLASFFCAKELENIFEKLSLKFSLAFLIQMAVISSIVLLKTQLAWSVSKYEFETAADEIRKLVPKYVFLGGDRSLSLGVYLHDWSIYGPEVANSSIVAFHGGKPFLWVFSELKKSVDKGEISAVLWANDECEKNYYLHPTLSPLFTEYKYLKALHPWLCIYSKAPIN